MNMQEIREVARQRHVSAGRLRKGDLIRTLQRLEGNFDCFGSAREGICSQIECLWRKDCLGLKDNSPSQNDGQSFEGDGG